MLIDLGKQIKTALLILLFFSCLTGLIYPVLITFFAQLLFPYQANGSLIYFQGNALGSELIGQYFDSPRYFWGRPSATKPFPYNAERSEGSNLGPSNPDLLAQVKKRMEHYGHSTLNPLIPIDLVTASASGLDPEISPLAAMYQIPRIAKARHSSEHDLMVLVNQHIKKRSLLLLGEPRINVLELNIALDNLRTAHD